MKWATHVPQIYQWCARLPVKPAVPVGPSSNVQYTPNAQHQDSVVSKVPVIGKGDIETLHELAQHFMDLARVAGVADSETRKEGGKEREVNREEEVGSEIIYL